MKLNKILKMFCHLNVFKDDSNALKTQNYFFHTYLIYNNQIFFACQTMRNQMKLIFVRLAIRVFTFTWPYLVE